jgi:flagellar export protein FliJ
MGNNDQFRLQQILNYKSSKVDTLEVEFAQLKTAYQNEVDILRQFQQTRNQRVSALHQHQNGKLNCDTIQLHHQYLQTLGEFIAQQAILVEEAKYKVDVKRDELVRVVKDQKTLEKLRDNHLAERKRELYRREARIVDDLVTSRYGRGK